MRVVFLIASLAGACAGADGDDKPPMLPWTGEWGVERDHEWVEQSSPYYGTYLTSIYVEERSAHFGMLWGGTTGFGSGNCRVAADYTFSCPTSEVMTGDAHRGGPMTSKMTGKLLSVVRMEVHNEVAWECVGDGCPPGGDSFYGIETAVITLE